MAPPWRHRLLLLVVLAVLPAGGHAATTLTGTAEVIDGDTIRLGETVVRLADIDAPEMGQRCDGPKALQRCGVVAAGFLADRIEGETVTCEVAGLDAYGRSIAACSHQGQDISAWLVAEGYAMAFVKYSARLVPLQEEAEAKLAGLWEGHFEPPWDYRARRWQVAGETAPNGCAIKGNISLSSGERIYHAPWSPHYERTKITESKGERWFCSEGEALEAGWRPPRR